MNEKEFNNEFRFSLYQGNVLLGEKVFDADQFNPFTRYSIDIREILPRAITKLQKVLSKRSYVTELNERLDLFQYHQKMISLYPQEYRGGMRYNPQPIVQQIEEKVIRGVECKIGFYINDKTIVERLFYVDGFNPVARWSVDLIDTVVEVGNTIFNHIKRDDIDNMWDDYDLINIKGLSINQIRELPPAKREEMLRKLRKN
ncbi:MAG TPA: hypothetical protein PKG96_09385 [Bacilli bacterium]|nr:hypothetical protein [Bacilli bacterium]